MFQDNLSPPFSSSAPSPRRLARAISGVTDKKQIDDILQRVLDQSITTELLSPFFGFIHSLLTVCLSSTEINSRKHSNSDLQRKHSNYLLIPILDSSELRQSYARLYLINFKYATTSCLVPLFLSRTWNTVSGLGSQVIFIIRAITKRKRRPQGSVLRSKIYRAY
jgi:hypothetical protein